MKLSECRTCKEPIFWVVTDKGKRMPMDAEPVSSGKWVVRDGETVRASYIGDKPYNGDRYSSHFQTCPQAAEHSRRERDKPAMEGECKPSEDGFCSTHPTCDLVRVTLESLRRNVKA
jgi:hypothetical protein